ncbi:DUF6344 domain-containing protein [Streptomyces sp. NBC_00414]|uniref:DUF6344 domain-containing protein n=1 Tax=Streptomyces sp. NBC_00414 TaxID=2975739 RepID=UPI002E1CF8F1
MTRNPVMNLWTAVVAAFLALCTSLGLITTTAVAAVPATESARNTDNLRNAAAQEEPIRTRPRAQSLPPTMKQRIHAEAHGSSPSCRHRPPTDAMDTDTAVAQAVATAPAADRSTTDAVVGATGSAATALGATGSGARKPATRDITSAPARPAGITGTTTGVIDTGTGTSSGTPGSTAGHVGEFLTHATPDECAPEASEAPEALVALEAPAMDAAPVTAVSLPSQSSALAQLTALPAQLPAPVPDSAPVLASVGAATQG